MIRDALSALYSFGGALGTAGEFLRAPPELGGGATVLGAFGPDVPAAGGSPESVVPQLEQTPASSGLTVRHSGHSFSLLAAVGGLKHMPDLLAKVGS